MARIKAFAGLLRSMSLIKKCAVLSILFHVTVFGGWHIKKLMAAGSSRDINIANMDVDFFETPALREKIRSACSKDWVEGAVANKPEAEYDRSESNSGEGDGFISSSAGDRPPKALFNFDMERYFPKEARKANIKSRVVVVRVCIDEDGKLVSSRVISEPSGYGFDQAALDVVGRARFLPGYKNGSAVSMIHDMAIRFMLEI